MSVIAGLLVLLVTTAGAFYSGKAQCETNTNAITTLRREHEECEKAAATRWERLNEALTAMQIRAARSEEKLDLLVHAMRKDQ